MPYKHEIYKLKLPPNKDRRRKLSEEQKEEIRKLYAQGNIGQRPLAKMFGVDRSTIQLIVNPQRAEAVKNRIKEHWRDYRPTKEEWAATQRDHRRYKQELYLNGELQ